MSAEIYPSIIVDPSVIDVKIMFDLSIPRRLDILDKTVYEEISDKNFIKVTEIDSLNLTLFLPKHWNPLNLYYMIH